MFNSLQDTTEGLHGEDFRIVLVDNVTTFNGYFYNRFIPNE